MTADPRLITALDLPDTAQAQALADRLGDAVSFYKIGLQLFATDGMALARRLKGEDKQVFLDWKLHDIGATVERAAAALAGSGCDFLTVHGEPQVMRAAVRGRGGAELKILAVTVLTSLSDHDLAEIGYVDSAAELVARRVRQAIDCGCDGVISSPHEASAARAIAKAAGRAEFLVVTPGVRPSGSALDDQARAATPASALQAGATHLVVGRPITAAEDPRAVALAIAKEMGSALTAAAM
jgi:orotidine-5'-phosphate decarboxylase